MRRLIFLLVKKKKAQTVGSRLVYVAVQCPGWAAIKKNRKP